MKAKLVPLPLEQRERGWINCQRYIIGLTSCSTQRHFCSTCKWSLTCKQQFCWEISFENCKLNICNLLGNNHLSNYFAEVITIKTLFASAKPSKIADCWGELWGLQYSRCNYLELQEIPGSVEIRLMLKSIHEQGFMQLIPHTGIWCEKLNP